MVHQRSDRKIDLMFIVVLAPFGFVVLYFALYAIFFVFLYLPYALLRALFSTPQAPYPSAPEPYTPDPPTLDLVHLTEAEYNDLYHRARHPLTAERRDRWLTSSAR
jgi:hypothetical protein